MALMREAVAEKVQAITYCHEQMKTKRLGFLVRPVVLILGWLIVIAGFIAIPFPGPGWLIVFIGVGVLSLELHWASRLLAWGVQLYERISTWYSSRSRLVRFSCATVTCAMVWLAVGGATYVAWRLGAVPALDPVMYAVL